MSQFEDDTDDARHKRRVSRSQDRARGKQRDENKSSRRESRYK